VSELPLYVSPTSDCAQCHCAEGPQGSVACASEMYGGHVGFFSSVITFPSFTLSRPFSHIHTPLWDILALAFVLTCQNGLSLLGAWVLVSQGLHARDCIVSMLGSIRFFICFIH